jgi:hypothetical protein
MDNSKMSYLQKKNLDDHEIEAPDDDKMIEENPNI